MKIPFFYLDLGHIQIFQPQNQGLRNYEIIAKDENADIRISSFEFPEILGKSLFLNGSDSNSDHSFCINVENDQTAYMTELIELLETIEV